jgi:hypothetical protein
VLLVLHQEVERQSLLLLHVRFLVGGRAEFRMLQFAQHPDLFSAVSALHSSIQSAETRSPNSQRTPWVRSGEYPKRGRLNVALPGARPSMLASQFRMASSWHDPLLYTQFRIRQFSARHSYHKH